MRSRSFQKMPHVLVWWPTKIKRGGTLFCENVCKGNANDQDYTVLNN